MCYLLSRAQLFVTAWTIACQSPFSMDFSRQEHWSRFPFPSSGDLPDPGIKTGSPTLQADSLPSEPSRSTCTLRKPKLKKIHVHNHHCSTITIATTWKHQSVLTNEWIKNMWYTYTIKYSVQFSSVTQSCPTLCNPMNLSTPGFPVHQQLLLKLMSIESAMLSSHLILCRPFLLLPPIPPSIRIFSNESTLHMMWPKYWSFSLSISPSNEHPWLITFRMDWLDLLAVQGTLKSLLQHHSSKASILWHSDFFTVQLSHPFMTTGKNIALTRRIFVGKAMSVLFNMLSRLVITSITQP